MPNTTIEVSIPKLEKEIEVLEHSIKEQEGELFFKRKLKEWAIGETTKHGSKRGGVVSADKKVDKVTPTPFILAQLGTGEKTSKEIIDAYAEVTDKKTKAVSNNITNALARLKTAKTIDSKKQDGSNTHVYYLIKKPQ